MHGLKAGANRRVVKSTADCPVCTCGCAYMDLLMQLNSNYKGCTSLVDVKCGPLIGQCLI